MKSTNFNTLQNQERCGSCVAFASMGMVESSYHKQLGIKAGTKAELDLSESSLYTCSNRIECSPGGMYLDDAIATLESIGVQREEAMPYAPIRLGLTCDRTTSRYMPFNLKATFLPSMARIQHWMRTKGGVMTAFTVPINFGDVLEANGGVYDSDDVVPRGGHAVVCTGYDNST
jgi:C1A family cysteine protease